MKIKLSKLFLFSSEVYRRQFALSHALFLLTPITLIYILGELVWWIAAIMIIINIMIFFLIRREYPSKLELSDKEIRFKEYNQLGRAGYGVKVVITLKNCRKFVYSQNRFEKIFNIGRIKVVADASCEVVSGNLGNGNYPLNRSYTFYGITKYSEVKAQLEKIFA